MSLTFKGTKTDLFNQWRRLGKDWGRVVMKVNRITGKRSEAKGVKKLMKVRDLVAKGMPLERAVQLRKIRQAQNLAKADDDFPDVEDEIMFWHTDEISCSTMNFTGESMAVEGDAQIEGAEQLDALLGDDGLLGAGLQLAVPGVNSKVQMAFTESMANLLSSDATGKNKLSKVLPKPIEADPNPPEVPIATPQQIAQTKCDEVQKELQQATIITTMLDVSWPIYLYPCLVLFFIL